MPVVPLLSGRDVVKTFGALGWQVSRQSGSHIILVKEGHPATLSVPNHKQVARHSAQFDTRCRVDRGRVCFRHLNVLGHGMVQVEYFVPAVENLGSLMNSDEYKSACQRPDAFTRGALEETVRVLQAEAPELASLIEQALSQAAIEKPRRHAGDKTTDYFRVHISAANAVAIRDAFVDKEAEAVSPDGGTTALARHYAGMADAWGHYCIGLAQ